MSEISRKDFLGLGTVAAAGLATGCASVETGDAISADLIVVDGRVLTQEVGQGSAEAFAVKDGRFLAVGSEAIPRVSSSAKSWRRKVRTSAMRPRATG